jgi:hypothetical protein
MKQKGEQQPQRTPLISPKSSMMFPFNMAQYFKRDGLPARRAWLIWGVDPAMKMQPSQIL